MKELQSQSAKFAQLNCQIVLVSFGSMIGASKWFVENKINEQVVMITDEKRVLYNYFDLKRSFFKVWNLRTLVYYSEQLLMRRELPKAYKDVEDDVHQMGGNFIIQVQPKDDNLMRLVYCYRSQNPPDRPSASQLIQTLKTLP